MRLSGQNLFTLSLMALLVGLTFWLQQASESKRALRDELLRHDPDYFVEEFTVRRHDAGGSLQSRLTARKMVHYPDDDTTVVSAPRLTFLKGAATTVLTAREGLIGSQGGEIVLVGEVRGVRSSAADPELVFTTTHLTVLPDDEVAHTDAAVTIVQGASVIRGTGMDADNKSRILRLHSQVSGTIEKRR